MAERINHKAKKKKRLVTTGSKSETSAIASTKFLAAICQELYSQVNEIAGYALLLKATKLKDKQVKYTDTIHTVSENLLRVMDNLHDLAGMESGKITKENSVMHLPSIMEHVYSLMIGKALEKNLDISLYISPAIPVFIVCDPTRLTQVLLNLATNAIKFTHKGFINIRADLDNITNEELHIKFTIHDSGIGIAKEHHKIIFDRFKLRSGSATGIHGRRSLGLNLVKHCVKLMGGKIFVKSKINKGSQFIVNIPAKKCSAAQVSNYKNLQNITVIDRRSGIE